uniref:Uncharacterized protein n=1 Tax=Ananas comosus var. bracteatus TaxID=296719 RepID=A0A6V7NUK1_ANACO|nr:unnamed protein product [Ananas comosus var. bracteatus]
MADAFHCYYFYSPLFSSISPRLRSLFLALSPSLSISFSISRSSFEGEEGDEADPLVSLIPVDLSLPTEFDRAPNRFDSRLGQMTNAKKGTETTIMPKDRIDSPSFDEGSSSGGSANGGAPVLKKGPWTSAEDAILIDYVKKHGEGNWNAVQKNSGLSRCGKSCRLRWANHLRPNLKRGAITQEERIRSFNCTLC